jgi:predicted AlkP superfamily pyrophosphatase or phosphodiesterase
MLSMLNKNHCRRVTIPCLTIIFLFASIAPTALAQRVQPAPKQSKQAAPKLVLLIAVDQFRYDYLDRFGALFGPSGIRRLLRD